MAALFSKDGGHALQLRDLLLFMCEVSALWMAFCRAAIRSAGKACERSNWSRYALATTKFAGHSIFCWFCTFSAGHVHRLRRVDFVLRQKLAWA